MDIRTDTSDRSSYHLDKERYLELKHFCLQYPNWKKELSNMQKFPSGSILDLSDKTDKVGTDTIYKTVAKMVLLRDKVHLVDVTLLRAEENDIIREYLKECITKGTSYAKLNAKYMVPCGRDRFYKSYRKFFYILSLISQN